MSDFLHEIARDRATTLTTETLKMNWQWASRIVIETLEMGAGNESRWAPVKHQDGHQKCIEMGAGIASMGAGNEL